MECRIIGANPLWTTVQAQCEVDRGSMSLIHVSNHVFFFFFVMLVPLHMTTLHCCLYFIVHDFAHFYLMASSCNRGSSATWGQIKFCVVVHGYGNAHCFFAATHWHDTVCQATSVRGASSTLQRSTWLRWNCSPNGEVCNATMWDLQTLHDMAKKLSACWMVGVNIGVMRDRMSESEWQ